MGKEPQKVLILWKLGEGSMQLVGVFQSLEAVKNWLMLSAGPEAVDWTWQPGGSGKPAPEGVEVPRYHATTHEVQT